MDIIKKKPTDKKKKAKKSVKNNSAKKKKQDSPEVFTKKVIWVCVAVFLSGVLLFILALGLGIYFLGWNNLITQNVSKVIPYPVAIVPNNLAIVTVNEFNQETSMLRRYHEIRSLNEQFSDYDLSQGEGANYFQVTKKNLLNQMIRAKLIEDMAKKKQLNVSDEEIKEQMDGIIKEHGGEEVLANKLKQVYGIDLDDFAEISIKDQLLERRLYQYLLKQGQISADEESFNDWFKNEARNYWVFIPLKEYYWNKDNAEVKFKNKDLDEYEQELIQEQKELIAQ